MSQTVPAEATPVKHGSTANSQTENTLPAVGSQVDRPQQQRQVQQKPPSAAIHTNSVSALDAVIDEVLAGDMSMEERQLRADEMAYSYFSAVREAAGDELDAETSAKLNELAVMTTKEQAAIYEKTNKITRKVLRPLGYKMLEVQGIDPATVAPAVAREALEMDLNPQQQAVVDAEAERLYNEVYLPELKAIAADLEMQDPEEAWDQFGRQLLARQPEEPQQQSAAAIAVPAALAGAIVALVVSKVCGWLQRRRRQRRHQQSGSEYYEEELVTNSDSAKDDASLYAE